MTGDFEGPIRVKLTTPGRPQGSPPLQRNGTATSLFVVFVRAGVAWSGVGTLAVALGGVSPHNTQTRRLLVWEKLPLEKGLLRDERVMALLKGHNISNSFFCLSILLWCLFVSSV